MNSQTPISLREETTSEASGGLFRHPPGLYVLFLTEMWERFSFYGMRALLVFYLTKHLLLTDQISLGIYGAYVALGYATPVIGGLLADRYLGQRLAVTFGAILMCLGHLGMAIEGAPSRAVINEAGVASIVHDEPALQIFYFSLALLIVGIGFLKPNIATIVSQLYKDDDPRRASGYTIFQMGIMLGAALSAGVCGYLGEQYGWSYGFGAAGIGMFIGLVIFLSGQRALKGVAEPPSKERLHQTVLGPLSPMHLIVLGAAGAVVLFWLLLQHTQYVGYLLGGFSAFVVGFVLFVSIFRCNKIERDRMLTLLVLQLALTFFATLFEQAGGALNLFADRNVDRHIGSGEIKASQLQSVVPATIVLLAPFFAWLWPKLSEKGRNPRTPAKYALTMVLMGCGFGILALATSSFAVEGKIALAWLLSAYVLFGVADLIIVSVCYTTITLLSLPRIVGMMMGTSMLAISAANFLAARIATWMGPLKSTAPTSPVETLSAYSNLFSTLSTSAFICTAILLLLSPFLSKRMHGIH
ncbi:peptide MFS transporter [Planctomicrobium sp. SH527]|uniref:peptide MFS transporter n=1 Tax=Planctomicrobium sp. SH527 TaxID=3448123 RepID=UPI003F5B5497